MHKIVARRILKIVYTIAMANAQLVDYAKQQLKKGIAREAVLKALKDVGWPEAEITAAMAEAEGGAGTSPAVMQVATSVQPAASVGQAVQAAQTTVAVAESDMSFKINEIMMSPSAATSDKVALPKGKSKLLPLVIILSFVSLAAIGAAGYFFMQGKDGGDKMTSLNEKMKGMEANLTLLSQAKQDLEGKIAALTQEKEVLNAELAPFVSSEPFQSSTPELPLTVKGILSGGDNRTFAVTTPSKVTFYVKNWKDKGVDAALRPNLGKEVTIGGTHAPGSVEFTATDINGTTIQFSSTTSTTSTPTTSASN